MYFSLLTVNGSSAVVVVPVTIGAVIVTIILVLLLSLAIKFFCIPYGKFDGVLLLILVYTNNHLCYL